MNYNIVIDDYLTKQSQLLESFTDKYNAISYIDSFIYDYLELKQGTIKLNNVVFSDKNDFSLKKDIYIVVKKKNDIDDKRYVYHKIVDKGILFNTVKYIKVFGIGIVNKPFTRDFITYDNRGYLYDCMECYLDKVLTELEQKFEFKKVNETSTVTSDGVVIIVDTTQPDFLSPITI